MIIRMILILALLLVAPIATAKHLHLESWYQDQWCHDRVDVKLPDGTEVDCLTQCFAIEVDFAPKWYEAAGQALHYARVTGKNPGVLLIIETPKDCVHLERLKQLAEWNRPRIKVWTTGPVQCPE